MLRTQIFAVALSAFLAAVCSAAEDAVELAQTSPPEGLAEGIAEALSDETVKVTAGGKELCQIWLRKDVPALAGFKPAPTTMYPFEPGELLGVVKYAKRGGDFRDQQFKPGVYTLRFGLQPQDGNHVGTSDTRDFLCLVPAADDKALDKLDADTLNELSAKVPGGTHPAILSLLAPPAKDAKTPAMIHNQDRELHSLRITAQAKAGEETQSVPLEFVVVGHAAE